MNKGAQIAFRKVHPDAEPVIGVMRNPDRSHITMMYEIVDPEHGAATPKYYISCLANAYIAVQTAFNLKNEEMDSMFKGEVEENRKLFKTAYIDPILRRI